MKVRFRSIAIGETASGWGDEIANYDRPIWITFEKTDENSARVLMEGDKHLEGVSFLIDPNALVNKVRDN